MTTAAETARDQGRWRRLLRRLLRISLIAALVGAVAGLVAAGVAWWAYDEYVVRHPGKHIDRDVILSIIAEESPVYFNDGQTRIGVFFDGEHREFVPFDDIPLAYRASIVAAEDGTFWAHRGVEPKHIVRAMWENLTSGKTVSGGSTLTQQTAKNLYYRPDRTWRSKGTEFVNALRLEHHYPKSDILTFYANQFHVSGNGRGLGIASRYFFDEDVEGLDLLQSAFLAGLVKSPSYYDPFLGDDARRARSLERGYTRTRYVLRRLVEEDALVLAGPYPDGTPGNTQADYDGRVRKVRAYQMEAKALLEAGFEDRFRTSTPATPGRFFRRGTFRYESSAVLDEVRRRLREDRFQQVLDAAGIEDPETAGLSVITTLDPNAQREATYGLWHHLTELGTQLERIEAAAFVLDDGGPRFDPDAVAKRHEFRRAQVAGVREDKGKKVLDLDMGGVPCVVDRDGVIRAAVAVKRGMKGDRNAKVPTAEVDAFLENFPVDAVVWVSVREVGSPATCDLEVRPELQGAAIALEAGKIRAMVGGNDNRNFNRATALRQFGSTWKPVVYHAAIELGWRPEEPLDNTRGVFPFSTTFYYPRPAHDPHPVVSMAWAGVNSENLASVWLLYHLTDRLNGEQVRTIADAVGLSRRSDESVEAYRRRIQEAGVLPLRSRIEEGLFLQARQEVISGLALGGHPQDALPLASMHYGWGFSRERPRVGRDAVKRRALDNSWTHLEGLIESCERHYDTLKRDLDRGRLPPSAQLGDLTVLLDGDRVRVACGTPPTGYAPPESDLIDALLREERALDDLDVEELLRPGSLPSPARDTWEAPQLVEAGDVLVDDRIHLGTLVDLRDSIARRAIARDAAGVYAPDLYDPEVLYWHQDFRVLLGMRYVEELARQYGVRTDIRPVLSMPLGASEITLEEMTRAYEGLTTGLTWEFPSGDTEAAQDPALLIERILDVNGNLLYQAQPTSRAVVAPATAAMTSDILRNVVVHGTGRRALDVVRDGAHGVPVGGKTGTTNDFRNAAFVGFAPHAEDGSYEVVTGYTVGVYVGYDDNREMASGNLRVDGSRGALPAWIATVDGLQRAKLLGAAAGNTEGRWWPLRTPSELVRVPVDASTGLPLAAGTDSEATILSSPAELPSLVEVAFERVPRPARVAPTIEDLLRSLEEERAREASDTGRRRSIWHRGRGE